MVKNHSHRNVTAALALAIALVQTSSAITPEGIEAMEVKSPLPGAITLNAMAAVGNTVVAIGLDGAGVKSTNGGMNWSTMPPFVLNNRFQEMYGCATDGTRIVATGGSPAVTTDFETWQWGTWTGGFRFDVAFGAGKFVATGRVSNVAVSEDGLTWSEVELPAGTQNLEVIEFGNGVFVGAGAKGRILRSTDG